MRGTLPPPPSSFSLSLFLRSRCEGLRPSALPGVGAFVPRSKSSDLAPAPTSGPTRPTPGVPFVSRRKEPKACRGCRPWTLPVQEIRPHWCCADACTRATFSHKNRPICHFELVGKSVLFFPLAPSREHFQLSIRGTVDCVALRMPRACLLATNTARVEGRGIKGGRS